MNTLTTTAACWVLGLLAYGTVLQAVYRHYDRRAEGQDDPYRAGDLRAFGILCGALWPLWLVFIAPRFAVLAIERWWRTRGAVPADTAAKGPYR